MTDVIEIDSNMKHRWKDPSVLNADKEIPTTYQLMIIFMRIKKGSLLTIWDTSSVSSTCNRYPSIGSTIHSLPYQNCPSLDIRGEREICSFLWFKWSILIVLRLLSWSQQRNFSPCNSQYPPLGDIEYFLGEQRGETMQFANFLIRCQLVRSYVRVWVTVKWEPGTE